MITFKQGLPLKLVKEIPYVIIKKLETLSITTCEEFISLVHDDHEGFAKFLGISNERLLLLYEIVRNRLTPQLAKELEEPAEKFAYGYISPHREEFDASED